MRVAQLCLFVALLISTACSGTSRDRGAAPRQGASAATSPTEDANALRLWAGSYEYADSAGPTAGDTGVVITYRLEIPKDTPSQGTLSVVGFQADRTLRCEVSATPTELTVRFLSYGDGRTENEFGVAVYQPRQVLFTLQRAADGNALLTTWQALTPDGAHGKSGKYFQKAGATSR